MIASTSSNVQVTGTLDGEVIDMDFHKDSMEHLAGVLINMYEDPERACIREIATNGRDATIEAGSDRPIEVTTPGPLSPFLKIRDFGCGLSRTDIAEIYSKYGASTKRETNDQTGCLGIGSKSPLAYCSQFTVSSVKDGVRVEVAVSLSDAGTGRMIVVDERKTDEPSGTEVVIPAKRHNAMASKAKTLFSYWPEGSVLLDGEPVDRVEGLVFTDKPATIRIETPDEESPYRDILIERMLMRDDVRDSIIVMGGVPYPIPHDHNKLDLPYRKGLVVWVGMGQVNFHPSRERLRETKFTLQAIKAIHDHFDSSAHKVVQREINACSNAGEALRKMIEWTGLLPSRVIQASYDYKGMTMPAEFTMPTPEDKMVVLHRHPHKLNACSRYNKVNATTAADAIWFFNYRKETFTAGQRKKINMWAESKWDSTYDDGYPEHFILVDKMPDATFLDPARVFDWDLVIEPLRLPRASGGRSGPTGRLAGSYDLYQGTTFRYGIDANDIDTSYPVYYFKTGGSDPWSKITASDAHRYVEMLAHFDPDCTVVCLSSNRIDKFLRNFPGTETAQAACERITKEWLETVDDKIKELIAFEDAIDMGRYERLAKHRPFADPDIEATLDRLEILKQKDLTGVRKERKVLLNLPSFKTDWRDPMTRTKYPLAYDRYGYVHTDHTAHIAAYLNVAYTLNKAKEDAKNNPQTTN